MKRYMGEGNPSVQTFVYQKASAIFWARHTAFPISFGSHIFPLGDL